MMIIMTIRKEDKNNNDNDNNNENSDDVPVDENRHRWDEDFPTLSK